MVSTDGTRVMQVLLVEFAENSLEDLWAGADLKPSSDGDPAWHGDE